MTDNKSGKGWRRFLKGGGYAALLLSTGASGAASWQSLPLTTIAQKAAGIAGGEGFQQVMAIAYAPSAPEMVYLASDTTRVWRSGDGGHHWRSASNGLDANGVCSLRVHPENPKVVFAAACLGPEAARARKSSKRREGIFLTTDGGRHWSLVRLTEFHKQRSMGSLFAIAPRSLQDKRFTVYAGSYSEGLLVSRDGGRQWNRTGFNPGPIRDLEVSPADPGTLLLATAKGLYNYRGGKATPLGKDLPGAPTSLAVTPVAPERIVVAVGGRVMVSDDGGSHFRLASSGLPPAARSHVADVYASPLDAERLYATTWKSQDKGPFFSRDGGRHWSRSRAIHTFGLTAGKGFWFPSPIAPHPSRADRALPASNGRTVVLRTADGGDSWDYSGSGYTGGRVMAMAVVSDREWYVGLTDHGLWHTLDGGESFAPRKVPGVHPTSIGGVAVSGRQLVMSIGGWNSKHLVISDDGGAHWRHVRGVKGALNLVRHHPDDPRVIYAGAFRSNDGSRNWVRLGHAVRAVFPGNGDLVYGFDRAGRRVLASFDRGDNWSAIAHCADLDGRVNGMAADPQRVGVIYLASNQGVFKVENGHCRRLGMGKGFNKDRHGSYAVRSIAIDPADPLTVYAGRWAPGRGASTGLYRSTDGGIHWQPFNSGMSDLFDVWSIHPDGDGSRLFIGSTFGLQSLAL